MSVYTTKYYPDRNLLGIDAEVFLVDLGEELKLYQDSNISAISILGTPGNMSALSDYPRIEKVDLDRCGMKDFSALKGLTKLRHLSIGFGQLTTVDLSFCSESLTYVMLFRVSRIRDLSKLTCMPQLETMYLDSNRKLMPPDFRMFPNLRDLGVRNTNWPSLKWLAEVPTLESLSIWGAKVADNDWRPLLELPHLRELHGMHTVFRKAERDEFLRLRPGVKLT